MLVVEGEGRNALSAKFCMEKERAFLVLGDGALEGKITRGSAGCWALVVGSLNGDVEHVEVGILGSGRVQCGATHWAANRYSIYCTHTVL